MKKTKAGGGLRRMLKYAVVKEPSGKREIAVFGQRPFRSVALSLSKQEAKQLGDLLIN